jgi:flagellar hook-associated protein FlgK
MTCGIRSRPKWTSCPNCSLRKLSGWQIDSSVCNCRGKPVVNVSSACDLATVQSGTSVPVQWLNHNKTPVDITAQPSAGKLGGLIEVRDTFLTNYRGQLDILAAGLIKAVNSLHSNGIDLTPFTSQTGTNAGSDPSTFARRQPSRSTGSCSRSSKRAMPKSITNPFLLDVRLTSHHLPLPELIRGTAELATSKSTSGLSLGQYPR